MKHKLATPLSEIKGIGPKFVEKLNRLNIHTVKDLLYHLPSKYQDLSKITKISELQAGQTVTVNGIITALSMSRTSRKKMYIIRATIDDGTSKIKVVWFNQKYIMTILKKGMSINLSGKVSIDNYRKLYLSSPIFEVIKKQSQITRHTGRIVPIYPETRGITSRAIRLILSRIIDYIKDIDEFLPEDILKQNKLPKINEAFRNVHFPKKINEAKLALKRFSFQDLFLLELLNANKRFESTQHKADIFKNKKIIDKYIENLPFKLTSAQERVISEILDDLSQGYPTSRLLQGDVGSGKTIVATLSALLVAENNKQSAFMAPTEILANQHYQTFIKFFKDFNKGVALLTSSQTRAFFGDELESKYKKSEIIDKIKSGVIKIIIGTHSIIQKNISFNNLSFVIIDEQHRFGIKQRAELVSHKTNNKILPHFLSMSATPIPRTLALTAFGDLEISIIDTLPKNRKKIITKIVTTSKHPIAYEFIRKKIKEGRQAFVVCPRIEPPEENIITTRKMLFQLDLKSVKEEYEKLSKKIFPDLNIAMIHGKMKSSEKKEIMSKFNKGKIDILVSTSVIEVGIDIPNATVMIIEGAERFGLSQLYQFRGRVGRGSEQSYCLLFTESRSITTKARLKALVTAKNGFELAEIDLKFRGPGQFLGNAQTGMPDLAMKAFKNPELVKIARKVAMKLITKDPKLTKYPHLSKYLELFSKDVHGE